MVTPWNAVRWLIALGAVVLDVTISPSRSPLVREPPSQENHLPMNLIHNAVKPVESTLVSSQDLLEGTPWRVRVMKVTA
jgi:hypothetical protein